MTQYFCFSRAKIQTKRCLASEQQPQKYSLAKHGGGHAQYSLVRPLNNVLRSLSRIRSVAGDSMSFGNKKHFLECVQVACAVLPCTSPLFTLLLHHTTSHEDYPWLFPAHFNLIHFSLHKHTFSIWMEWHFLRASGFLFPLVINIRVNQ